VRIFISGGKTIQSQLVGRTVLEKGNGFIGLEGSSARDFRRIAEGVKLGLRRNPATTET